MTTSSAVTVEEVTRELRSLVDGYRRILAAVEVRGDLPSPRSPRAVRGRKGTRPKKRMDKGVKQDAAQLQVSGSPRERPVRLKASIIYPQFHTCGGRHTRSGRCPACCGSIGPMHRYYVKDDPVLTQDAAIARKRWHTFTPNR